ncbi:MAG: redoxin domain-containing protein [Ktedonobacterales bacterium]
MRLRPGQLAPQFEVRDIYGQRIRLADYAGSKVLLSFHRAAVCPLCTMRTYHMINRYPEYRRRGMAVISFWESSPEQAYRYLDQMHAPFPIIADRERAVYARYGLESSLFGTLWGRLTRGSVYREAAKLRLGAGTIKSALLSGRAFGRMPGDFLIGPDQRIIRVYYGHDAGDFMLFSEIDAFATS